MDVNNKISNISNSNVNDISNSSIKKNNISIEKANKSNNIVHNINVESNNIIDKDDKNKSNNIEKQDVSKETLDKIMNEVNHKFKIANKEFSYDIHEKTNRVSVKIKDSETGDIIKEIPSEESLDMAAKIMEMAGLLIDEKS